MKRPEGRAPQLTERGSATRRRFANTTASESSAAPTHSHALRLKESRSIPDRSHKATAPEPLQPNNRFGSTKESLKHFRASRAKTIAFLKTTEDLRGHAMASPLGKDLDAYEWILFVAAHSERHTKQIEEVKADPGFPKK